MIKKELIVEIIKYERILSLVINEVRELASNSKNKIDAGIDPHIDIMKSFYTDFKKIHKEYSEKSNKAYYTVHRSHMKLRDLLFQRLEISR